MNKPLRKLNTQIKEVAKDAALRIIETRYPLGLFYCKENDQYFGIDNSEGDAWMEEFKTLKECKKWLLKEEKSC
jgi:hypothetical protein